VDDRSSYHSRGFTLVEVLVVVSLFGLIATVISAAFVVIARTNPQNEERAADARALLNLSRWLPDDVASTYTYPYFVSPAHQNGFTADGSNPTCVDPGALPNGGESLLNLRWYESSTTYYVDYVWTRTGDVVDGRYRGEVARFSCFAPTSGSPGPAERARMSPSLSELPGDTPPVDVCQLTPLYLNDPNDPEYDAAAMSAPDCDMDDDHWIVGGVTFTVQVFDDQTSSVRDTLNLVAVSKNVQGPELGSAGGGGSGVTPNQEAPVAYELLVEMHPGTTETFDLPVFDYDGTLDRLVISPVNPDATPHDPAAGWNGWVVVPTVNEPDPKMTVTAPETAGVDTATEFTYDVQDRNGLEDSQTADPPGMIRVTVRAAESPLAPPEEIPPPPQPPPCETEFAAGGGAAPNPVALKRPSGPNPDNEVGKLNDDVDVTIVRAGACAPLVLRFIPDPSTGLTEYASFDNSLEVTIRKTEYTWRVGAHVLELVEQIDGGPVVRDWVNLEVVQSS
jgi:prepilin-type N-terminal cleavage/methylation domain-containing protein